MIFNNNHQPVGNPCWLPRMHFYDLLVVSGHRSAQHKWPPKCKNLSCWCLRLRWVQLVAVLGGTGPSHAGQQPPAEASAPGAAEHRYTCGCWMMKQRFMWGQRANLARLPLWGHLTFEWILWIEHESHFGINTFQLKGCFFQNSIQHFWQISLNELRKKEKAYVDLVGLKAFPFLWASDMENLQLQQKKQNNAQISQMKCVFEALEVRLVCWVSAG